MTYCKSVFNEIFNDDVNIQRLKHAVEDNDIDTATNNKQDVTVIIYDNNKPVKEIKLLQEDVKLTIYNEYNSGEKSPWHLASLNFKAYNEKYVKQLIKTMAEIDFAAQFDSIVEQGQKTYVECCDRTVKEHKLHNFVISVNGRKDIDLLTIIVDKNDMQYFVECYDESFDFYYFDKAMNNAI